jgi:hypothetical protein
MARISSPGERNDRLWSLVFLQGRDGARTGKRHISCQPTKEAPMKMLIPALPLLLLVTGEARAIKITAFTNTDTFVERANDIVIAKCLGPVPDGRQYDDGLYPVDVQVLAVVKGPKNKSMELGKAKIATIYPMEAGKTYLLTSMGGSAYGTGFLAVAELSVIEVPANLRLSDLKGKTATEQVQAVFAGRRQEVERQQRLLEDEKRLLDKAVSK